MRKNEVFMKDGELISIEEWNKKVDKWLEYDKNTSLEEIKELIKEAIINRVEKKQVGVMFSGGVDSTLIAKVLIDHMGKDNVVLVTVGFFDEGRKYPEDLVEAEKSAKELGCKLISLVVNEKESIQSFDKIIKLLRKKGEEYVNSVNVSVGAVEVVALEKFKDLGIKQVFGGLGSEEVFAGYLRHESNDDLKIISEKSIKDMITRDLVREVLLSKHYKIIVSAPFMDEELLKRTFIMDEEIKKSDGHNKFAVRSFANDLGQKNAFRKKRAAQYGSRTQSYLEKICNRKKYNTIKECLLEWK